MRASALCLLLFGCASAPRAPAPAPAPAPVGAIASAEPVASGASYSPGLEVVDVKIGDGPACQPNDTIRVRFVGTLDDGTQFDAQESATFTIGVGALIKGWDEGLPGMRVGGVRKLTVPASLGYGVKGAPPDVPPFAQLHFEIELLAIEPKE